MNLSWVRTANSVTAELKSAALVRGTEVFDCSRGREKAQPFLQPSNIDTTRTASRGNMDRTKKRPRLTPPDSETLSQSSSTSSSVTTYNSLSSPPRPRKLADLLDVRAISSHRDLDYRFGEIARSLIHEYVLVISTSISKQVKNAKGNASPEATYELAEVEFYLRKEGHEDPFAHATSEQGFSGRW